MIWQVKETPCYPAKWKVYPTAKYQETNETRNYFRTYNEAQREADKHNETE